MKIAKNIGIWLNTYIKNYGVSWFWYPIIFGFVLPVYFWPRRTVVQFICCIISQIDEEEYFRCRNAIGFKDI